MKREKNWEGRVTYCTERKWAALLAEKWLDRKVDGEDQMIT